MRVKTEPIYVIASKWRTRVTYAFGLGVGFHYDRYIRFNETVRRITLVSKHPERPVSDVQHYYVHLRYSPYDERFFKTYRQALEACLNDMLEQNNYRG